MSAAARLGAALAAVGLAVGLVACGAPPPAVPAMPGPMMGATGDADDGYGGPGGMMDDRATTPAAALPHTGSFAGEGLDPARVLTLQSAVDQGAQPWRLEPGTTALAFARARFGWMMPRATTTAPDTVLVDDGAGGEVSLHLVQPGRTGTTGIWMVAEGTWVR
jgi:hypothetical protein